MQSSNGIGNKSPITDSNDKLINLAHSNTNRFRDRFENFLHREANSTSSNNIGFPMVCILVRGTIEILEILYQKLEQEIPVVIMKGTGSAADIIAFAHDEISFKSVLCRFFFLQDILCLFTLEVTKVMKMTI
jgi:hypothetical protein